MRIRNSMSVATLAVAALMAFSSASPAAAQESQQVKLTDALVKSYLAASKDLKAISPKLEAAGENVDAKLEAELEGIATKAGFKNYEELEDVSYTLSLVLDGFDPDSGAFGEPKKQLEKELAEVKADKSIPADEKKQLVADLEESIKSTPPLQHKENIEVVKKYRELLSQGKD